MNIFTKVLDLFRKKTIDLPSVSDETGSLDEDVQNFSTFTASTHSLEVTEELSSEMKETTKPAKPRTKRAPTTRKPRAPKNKSGEV